MSIYHDDIKIWCCSILYQNIWILYLCLAMLESRVMKEQTVKVVAWTSEEYTFYKHENKTDWLHNMTSECMTNQIYTYKMRILREISLYRHYFVCFHGGIRIISCVCLGHFFPSQGTKAAGPSSQHIECWLVMDFLVIQNNFSFILWDFGDTNTISITPPCQLLVEPRYKQATGIQ